MNKFVAIKTDDIGVYAVPVAKCVTPNGPGKVVLYEVATYNGVVGWVRLGVVLDNPPDFFPPIPHYQIEKVQGYPPPLEER